MPGETSSCLEEGKQEQHQDCVLENLPTEVSAPNDQVGIKNYVNEVGEGSEAANYIEDKKMQDLSQDVPPVNDSEFSAKSCGDASGFQNLETTGHQDHNVENIRERDSEEVVGLQGKSSDVELEETSDITLKHVVHEQLENQRESPKGLEEVGGQHSLEKGNESATGFFPTEAVTTPSKDVSASGSHPENAIPSQTYGSVYAQNHDALPISTENELSPHPASLNKEDVPFGGIEIHPEDRTCILATQQVEIPVEVISGPEQLELESESPKKNLGRSGRRYKTIAKATKKNYTLRSSLSSDTLQSKSVDNAKDVDLENEKANATTSEVKKRGRKKNSEKNVISNEYSRIRKNLSYMLNRIGYEQNLIDAYSSEGWKGLSLEKLKPDKEIERAKSEIVRRKLKIRDLFQHLDSLCAEGKLSEDLFDSEGMIDSEDIFCAKCGSKDLTLDNDIILCDGFCERGFHQFCLEPPLPKEEIPPDNEGWLCPGCDCKVECVDLLNESQGTKLSMKDSWEKVFPEAVKSGNLDPNSGLSTDDSEDDDYDPEKPQDDEEGNESGSGGSEYATASEKSDGGPPKANNQDLGLSSDDSEDDDYDPDAPDLDKVKEESSTSDFSSDSEDLAATLVDEGPVGGKKQNLDDESLMESDTGESGASPITAKRHVPRLDYKKLHDEEYGGTSSDESSDDEEWTDAVGTKKRKQQIDEPEASAKRSRVGKHTVSTNTSAGSQINDSPKSNSAGAKGQSSSNPKRRLEKETKEKLQEAFNANHFPDRAAKESLAQELGITYQQVDKWFGNARWFFNHPAGRKINVSGKAAKSNNPVPETVANADNDSAAAACSNGGNRSAVKAESSSAPGKKLKEQSPKSNKKTTRSGKSKTNRSRRQSGT